MDLFEEDEDVLELDSHGAFYDMNITSLTHLHSSSSVLTQSLQLNVIPVYCHYLRVVPACSLGEELGVVDVGVGRTVLPVRELFGLHVDEVVGYFPFFALSELDDALAPGVDGLVESDNHIVS